MRFAAHVMRPRGDLANERHPILADVRLKYPGSRHEPLRALLAERPELLECVRMTGEACYVLKVAARSMSHLQELVDQLADVGSVTTSLVYSVTQPYRDPV
jgi:Lrp/AsnC family leucine-responsive transcriptional regulator